VSAVDLAPVPASPSLLPPCFPFPLPTGKEPGTLFGCHCLASNSLTMLIRRILRRCAFEYYLNPTLSLNSFRPLLLHEVMPLTDLKFTSRNAVRPCFISSFVPMHSHSHRSRRFLYYILVCLASGTPAIINVCGGKTRSKGRGSLLSTNPSTGRRASIGNSGKMSV